jgi:hypothetical protein
VSLNNLSRTCLQVLLIILILFGIYLRFTRVNWSQGANLHPDEYGLTNTLTQLTIPKNTADYFNTRISPLSPYPQYDEQGQKVVEGPDNGFRWGQWPVILIRFVAEKTGNTGYDELRITGRKLSALADSIAVLSIILIGRRLYNGYVGLLAGSLSALAVMQIQQSHFMTVDNFATMFSTLAIYACVRIAQQPILYRSSLEGIEIKATGPYHPRRESLVWYLLFGVAFGMALASKINMLPLGGLILVAGFISIADLRLRSQRDLRIIFFVWAIFAVFSMVVAGLTFRLSQPMSFRQPVGVTTFSTFHLNPDWLENMKRAQLESNGVGGGPPGEQWAHRLPVVFPWVNMVLWGMGLPLGLMSWAGLLWAGWRTFRFGDHWRSHLVPLVWTGGYFFFMATRWVKSIRYFLPIYPFMALFAAWAMITVWHRYMKGREAPQTGASRHGSWRIGLRATIPAWITFGVVVGTLAWAISFVQAVYQVDHTRVQATRWIFENVAGPIHLAMIDINGNPRHEPITAPEGLEILPGQQFIQPFTPRFSGRLSGVILPHVASQTGSSQLRIEIATDPDGQILIDEAVIPVVSNMPPGQESKGEFHLAKLKGGITYYLIARATGPSSVTISRSVISNENWDEGLPFPFDHRDPFGQLYRGVTMEMRWYDDESKRQMFIDTLTQADFVILPSQRAIWTTCRIPRTYPMTMEYYRALFDGRLGFDLAASFSAPLRLGPLQVSDVAGAVSIYRAPLLPLFNHNLLAAEEAFSVYDHPPVWIFKKRPDFNLENVKQFFYSIDLSRVVIQSPREADLPPCE